LSLEQDTARKHGETGDAVTLAALTHPGPELMWQSRSDHPLSADLPADHPPANARAAWLEKPIIECFRVTAQQFGDRIAVDDGASRLTYAQLLDASSRLARAILTGLPDEGPIGILVPQENCFLVAVLACLAAGRSFVALDLNSPEDHNALIVRDAALAGLIVREPANPALQLPRTVACIDVDRAFDTNGESGDGKAELPAIRADEAMIILYTSGSTGRPKGIVQGQGSVLERVRQNIVANRADESDIFMPLSPACTLPGLRDCLAALLTGASVRILDQKRAGIREVCRVMRESKVTVCYAVPTVLRAFMQASDDFSHLASLRIMRVGGERVLWSDVRWLRQALPATCQINITFSSTEVGVSSWFVPSDLTSDEPTVPVGNILSGVDFAIVDEDNNTVPIGTVGELVVRSRYMALGHWENGRCVLGPMQVDPSDRSRRILHTGDLVSMGADGLLRVIARNDRRVKIRGQRVEPAELEAALRRSGEVVDAAVVVRQTGDDPTLVAFVIPTPEAGSDLVGRLRVTLRSTLRPALHPAALHQLESLPRLSGGKLDRRALLEIDRVRNQVPPSDPDPTKIRGPGVETTLLIVSRLWDRILGERSSTTDPSWDAAGGNSLQFLRLFFELEEILGRSLLPGPFRVDMTPAQMATAIDEMLLNSEPLSSSDAPARLFLFPGVGGDEPLLAALREDLRSRILIVTAQYPGWKVISDPRFGFEDMVAMLAGQISESAPEGPLRLAGYSYGGIVAFAVARQLRMTGRDVVFLGLLDTDISSPPTQRAQGPYGFLSRVIRLPSLFFRENRHDNLCRTLAHYLLSPRARALSLRLLDPRLSWFGADIRFSLDYWLCRLRRTDSMRRWLEALTEERTDVPTFLFRSEERVSPDLGWWRFFPALNIVTVPGDHFGMIAVRHRPELVRQILQRICEPDIESTQTHQPASSTVS
jgi:acyl-coenzyme A synthetase/AMP-(fatty) acid ligase/thioesterase domain-containing protein